jgi:hypothetical protein
VGIKLFDQDQWYTSFLGYRRVVEFKQIPPCAGAESMGPLEPFGGKRNDNLKTKQSSLDCVQIDIFEF